MYTKEELEKLSIPELMEIASELGVKVSQNDELESVIYAILDKAAENSAAGLNTAKRKRTRITKKDTDKVYTVTGSEGENLDAKPAKKKKAEKKPTIDSLFAEQEAAEQAAKAEQEKSEEQEKPAPKKRGRKSKKELEAIAAEEAAKAAEQTVAEETSEEMATIPEATAMEPSEPIEENLIS